MTFKDLRKKITSLELPNQEKLHVFKNKPFWIWNIQAHKTEDVRTKGSCCFNHMVGLPTKDRTEKPMFDYEKILYDILFPTLYSETNHFKSKHLWVKKATGLGVTEFILRLMAWLCIKDNSFQNSQMCIVCGPNIEIAIKLIKRLKGIFEPKLGLLFQNKETVLKLNRCAIEAYPSNHLDAYRALPNPKFIFIDEADFFRKGEQEDVRIVTERYIGKSDPYIVMVSTPNAPGGLFERIEKEPEEECIYNRIRLDYTYGIDKIYTRQEIEKAKTSPSFGQEYDLKYLGGIGNIFHTQDIERSIVDYETDNNGILSHTLQLMGIDPGFGSSAFGIVITQYKDEKVWIVYADQFDRPNFEEMISKVLSLRHKFMVDKTFIDGSSVAFIKSLKLGVRERTDYENVDKDHYKYMIVEPINFGVRHREMLQHTKYIVESNNLRIHPKFEKLIVSLKTAMEENEGKLDKESTSFDDIFDALRLSLLGFKMVNKGYQAYSGGQLVWPLS